MINWKPKIPPCNERHHDCNLNNLIWPMRFATYHLISHYDDRGDMFDTIYAETEAGFKYCGMIQEELNNSVNPKLLRITSWNLEVFKVRVTYGTFTWGFNHIITSAESQLEELFDKLLA